MKRLSLALAVLASTMQAQVTSTRRTAGDTVVVHFTGVDRTRTVEKVFSIGKADGAEEYVFGSASGAKAAPDGSLWIFDQTVPALRQYDSTGKFIRQVGRKGEGPGEYGQLLGIAPLRDGRLALFDPRSSRINIYDRTGRFTSTWQMTRPRRELPGMSTLLFESSSLGVDAQGLWGTATIAGKNAVIRFTVDGKVRDTLVLNAKSSELPMVRHGNSGVGVPFMPRAHWTYSSAGYFVGGDASEYRIDVLGPGRTVTRIEREIAPVPIPSDEREKEIDKITRYFKGSDPLWVWNGPDVPKVKPFFKSITIDDDGRIWVRLHVASELRVDTVEASRGRNGRVDPGGIREYYEEPPVYEVFTPNGRYLGKVRLPDFVYTPTIKGDYVWMGQSDADGIPIVTKYRIVPGLPR